MISSYQTFSLSDKLSNEQKEFFEQNGFLHFRDFIGPETISAIINASLRVQQQWVAGKVDKVNGVPVKYGKDLDGSRMVQRFAFINKHSEVLSGLLLDPRLPALLELAGSGSRYGADEKDGMVLNHYINSPESRFTQMGWHTDGLRDIFHGQRLNPMLNVGIHLSTLRPENGGLRILPGTHKQSLYQMLFRKRYFLDNNEDPGELAIIPAAGDLTVHDGRLWHRVARSEVEGESSRRRVIYIPIIAGKYAPKNENSPTALYQRFAGFVR